jgi:hypothetical protein
MKATLPDIPEAVLDALLARPASPLAPGARVALLDWLAHVLVNHDGYVRHVQYLQRRRGTNHPPSQPLDDAAEAAVLARGLTALPDEALSALAVDPVALSQLADAIDQEMPAAWLGVMAADGAALLARRGLQFKLPPVVMLLIARPLGHRSPVLRTRGADSDKDDGGYWGLTTPEGSPELPLPPEVARHCYGKDSATVQLVLHAAAGDSPDSYRPQVKISPPPKRAPLMVTLTFDVNGQTHERTFQVPPPPQPANAVASLPGVTLPAGAFPGAGGKVGAVFSFEC